MIGTAKVTPTIGVGDMEKATAFYGGVLGLHVAKELKDGDTLYEVFYDSGECQLSIYMTQYAGTNQATYCTWEVDNIEAEVAALKDAGVGFEHYDLPYAKLEGDIHVLGDGGEKAAWFRDPDGNILCLHQ